MRASYDIWGMYFDVWVSWSQCMFVLVPICVFVDIYMFTLMCMCVHTCVHGCGRAESGGGGAAPWSPCCSHHVSPAGAPCFCRIKPLSQADV